MNKKIKEKLGLTLEPIPEREKKIVEPSTNVPKLNAVHQADLLFLPNDNGFRYALVVVDLATGITEAIPLKSKDSKDVKEKFIHLYRTHSHLKMPKVLQVDSGGEFSKLPDLPIAHVRYAKTGRHRQQAVVESRNALIGNILNTRMTALENSFGKVVRDWVKFLPKAIKAINESLPKKKDRAESGKYPMTLKPILEEGTEVYVALEKPVDVHGKKLHGKFRKGDRRWESEKKVIHQIIMRPDQPVMYLVRDKNGKVEKVAYTPERLLVANKMPTNNVTGLDPPKETHFRVAEIMDTKGKKVLVRWVGYPDEKDWTWENKSDIPT